MKCDRSKIFHICLYRNIKPPARILPEEPAEEELEKEATAAAPAAGVSTRPGKTTPQGQTKEKESGGKSDSQDGRDSKLAPPASRTDKRPKSPKTTGGGAKAGDKSKSAGGPEAGSGSTDAERSPKYVALDCGS